MSDAMNILMSASMLAGSLTTEAAPPLEATTAPVSVSYAALMQDPVKSQAYFASLASYAKKHEHLYQNIPPISEVVEVDYRGDDPIEMLFNAVLQSLEEEILDDAALPNEDYMRAVLYTQDVNDSRHLFNPNYDPELHSDYEQFKDYVEDVAADAAGEVGEDMVDFLIDKWIGRAYDDETPRKGTERVPLGPETTLEINYELGDIRNVEFEGGRIEDYDLNIGEIEIKIRNRKKGFEIRGEADVYGASIGLRFALTDFRIAKFNNSNGKMEERIIMSGTPFIFDAKVEADDYEEIKWRAGIYTGSNLKDPRFKKRVDYLAGFGIRGEEDSDTEIFLEANVSWK